MKKTYLAPADFRLSAFGLPEPGGAPPPHRPAPWYVWLLTATGVSAALAVAFNHLRRRSQARRLTAETGG